MNRIIIFLVFSVPILILSWRTLFKINSHGFFRFYSWECIVWLFATNYVFWFDNPFAIRQIGSWIFLIISGYLVVAGVVQMKKIGKPEKNRNGTQLFDFEKTTELIEKGIFKYIRHPLYSSLLFLTWGIFLKNLTIELLIVSVISTIFIFLTSLSDEKECLIFFGDRYSKYMKRSKMFIPFLL